MMKPETIEFLSWVKGWMTEQGYEVQNGLPWKSWKANTPTIIYCLDNRELPAFGLIAHQTRLEQLALRLAMCMNTTPRPCAIYIFLPRDAPHWVDAILEGGYSYGVEVIEGPRYGYDEKHYDSLPWGSEFSVSMGKQGRRPKV